MQDGFCRFTGKKVLEAGWYALKFFLLNCMGRSGLNLLKHAEILERRK